jgi:hypothetical protein
MIGTSFTDFDSVRRLTHCQRFNLSFYVFEKFIHSYFRVPERAFERITVNLVVEGEYDYSTVGMLHLNVTAFTM